MPRINLQYSIEMEELAPEIGRLYKKANELINQISLIQYAESQILSSSIVNHIHETRVNLAKADAMLRDIQSVVSSYVEYELSQNQDEETQTPAAARQSGTLDDLQNSIEALSQQIEGSASDENPTQRA
jgi:hypothetical protein